MCSQDVIQTLGQAADTSWGIYLRVQSQQLLEASLNLLQSAYGADELHRPVWISMEGLQSSDSTAVSTSDPPEAVSADNTLIKNRADACHA